MLGMIHHKYFLNFDLIYNFRNSSNERIHFVTPYTIIILFQTL